MASEELKRSMTEATVRYFLDQNPEWADEVSFETGYPRLSRNASRAMANWLVERKLWPPEHVDELAKVMRDEPEDEQ